MERRLRSSLMYERHRLKIPSKVPLQGTERGAEPIALQDDASSWDFHFRRPRMDPLHTRKPQRPRESFSSHNRPGSEAVTQPALTSWG